MAASTPKTRRIRVSYRVTLTDAEFDGLVKLGREWGFQGKPLKVAKEALQNSGVSGCLAQIPQRTNY
jgi:hypothetical protein